MSRCSVRWVIPRYAAASGVPSQSPPFDFGRVGGIDLPLAPAFGLVGAASFDAASDPLR